MISSIAETEETTASGIGSVYSNIGVNKITAGPREADQGQDAMQNRLHSLLLSGDLLL
jgi:hypothetical protein